VNLTKKGVNLKFSFSKIHHTSDQSPLWQNKEFYKKKTTSTNITREGDFLHKKVVAHKQ